MSAAGRRSGTDARLASASDRGAAVLVDVENVRGKSSFELTHEQLLQRATLWTEQRGLRGHVSLIVDHGTVRRRLRAARAHSVPAAPCNLPAAPLARSRARIIWLSAGLRSSSRGQVLRRTTSSRAT